MPTTATAQNTGVVETAITFIQDGFFMYPILVVLALGLPCPWNVSFTSRPPRQRTRKPGKMFTR